MNFRQRLALRKHLILDGAMGTMLQARGLKPGQSPEFFCLSNPDVLLGVHADYIKAGSEVLTTNTFGGSRFKLDRSISVFDFNCHMAKTARKAAEAAGRPVFVAGSIGPSGKLLKPLGDGDFDELVDAYREQIRGLVEGGADLLMIETQFDIAEARAIVVAARKQCDLPICVSVTYEDGRTLTGSGVAVAAATLANMGVDLIGMNCSVGPEQMRPHLEELLRVSPIPVLVQPNAGLPVLRDGKTVFPMQPEQFAELTSAFASMGAYALGGCCGTGPQHIAALAARVRELPDPHGLSPRSGIMVTSRSQIVGLGQSQGYGSLTLIGERINPTGKKQLAAELQAGEFTTALKFSDEQAEAGALLLDVNVGAPLVDECVVLPDLVMRLSQRHGIPLVIDTANPRAMEEALKRYPASPLVNSISGEHGRMEHLGPLCRDFGAPFILLPLKGKDLPAKAGERIAIVEGLLDQMDGLGIPRHLAMVDILALSASSNPEAALECLTFIRHCRDVLHLPTVCGLSNISFGLPARDLVNSTFLSLAVGAGLNACIANPGNVRLREAVDAINLLFAKDEGAEKFIRTYSGWSAGNGASGAGGGGTPAGQASGMPPGQHKNACADPQSALAQAVILGRKDSVEKLIKDALAQGADPFALVGGCLIPAITEVGEKYERKEYFLPQLIRSAEVMQAGFDILKPLLEHDARAEKRPVIIMATVEGDIHDIGKNIVSLLLGNHGFEVIDLGKDVGAEEIVNAAISHNASVIGLSALMTTTMVRMEDTVKMLKEKNIAARVMVGGAVVTSEFAGSIGAHYARDAVGAVRLAKELMTS